MTKEQLTPEAKIWGETTKVASQGGFQVHYLRVKAGTYCSRHMHAHKWNIFYVTNGAVSVKVYPGPRPGLKIEELVEIRLRAGQRLVVPPMTFHRFVAHEDSELIEVYTTDEVREDDIQRADEGGVIQQGWMAP